MVYLVCEKTQLRVQWRIWKLIGRVEILCCLQVAQRYLKIHRPEAVVVPAKAVLPVITDQIWMRRKILFITRAINCSFPYTWNVCRGDQIFINGLNITWIMIKRTTAIKSVYKTFIRGNIYRYKIQ